jgi:type 1 glutamine amidotransferase
VGRPYLASSDSSPQAKRIVLIGGVKSHGPAQHDFPNGIPLIESLLKRATPFSGVEIVSFPNGFPQDLSLLNGASALVLYFDGVQTPPPPLLDPARIREMQKLMSTGAGLVCLHQASTVPEGNTTIPLVEWLGAKRNGMYDRTTESANLEPANPSFPICHGMVPFTYEDEFYPTLQFSPDTKRITPVLTPKLHIEFRAGKTIHSDETSTYTVAWAFERKNGGRSFGFTGCHYMAAFDQPQIRKMVLNAICWTSGLTVPAEGVVVRS